MVQKVFQYTKTIVGTWRSTGQSGQKTLGFVKKDPQELKKYKYFCNFFKASLKKIINIVVVGNVTGNVFFLNFFPRLTRLAVLVCFPRQKKNFEGQNVGQKQKNRNKFF